MESKNVGISCLPCLVTTISNLFRAKRIGTRITDTISEGGGKQIAYDFP
uniref:Uncharacterized protein n=1 Tax=Arundo donax TaxID=35708 RepID=A0A0A9AUG4_ARUDO